MNERKRNGTAPTNLSLHHSRGLNTRKGSRSGLLDLITGAAKLLVHCQDTVDD